MNENVLIERYEGESIGFQCGDAYVNATAMCAVFGKRPNDFLALSSTKAFQSALAADIGALPENLVTVRRGGDLRENPDSVQGTWLHPDLAIECARWLSPKFAIWCNRVIRRILAGQSVNNSPALPQSYLEALRALTVEVEAKERLALQNRQLAEETARMAPKEEFYDTAVKSKTTLELIDVAKMLGTGRTRLLRFLRERGIFRRNNTPYQQYTDAGYFRVNETMWEHPEHGPQISLSTRVYQLGVDFIRRLLDEDGITLEEEEQPKPKRWHPDHYLTREQARKLFREMRDGVAV